MSASKLKVLFLCTGNSCRSQMAEGWVRHLKSDRIDAYSAGTEIRPLDPNAVKVMSEAGVDISGQQPKGIELLVNEGFDCVVTLCSEADKTCPTFPCETRVVHVSFEDPPQLARNTKSDEDALNCYRRIRDEIRAFVDGLPEALELELSP